MGLILLAAFIAVPLVEIGVFIQVGGWIGLWPTLAIVVVTAIAGTALLRAQGLAVLNRARSQMDQGVVPAREMFDGICLVFAGALLLTPGFVTDAVGLLLFVQPVRDALRGIATRYVERHGRVYTTAYGPGGRPGGPDPRQDPRFRAGPRGGNPGGAPGGAQGGAQGDPNRPDPDRDAGVEPPPQPGRGWGKPGAQPGTGRGGQTIEGDYRDVTDGSGDKGDGPSKGQ
jgi:UPF0716 protein FxsA